MNTAPETWFIPAPTDAEKLAAAQAAKITEINATYTAQAQPLIKDYPEIEQQSWTEQNREARAYLSWYEGQQDEAPETPVLDQILVGRNGKDGTETLQELCLAVIDNADQFTQFQQLTGKRQRLVKAARQAQSQEALDGISW